MKELFGFLDFEEGMVGIYEQRKIDRFEEGKVIIDTCEVTDSDKPYETGVKHPNYNKGDWVIVDLYNTVEEAKEGHKNWVKILTAEKLPKVLKDVSTCEVVSFVDALAGKEWRKHEMSA